MTLKKLPCVSFAGVDSLDDVKNHTYNELFVSGGFIVSDESILNPEVVTIGKNEYVIFSVLFLGCGCPGFSGKIKTKGLKSALLLCHSQLTGLFLSFSEFLPPKSSPFCFYIYFYVNLVFTACCGTWIILVVLLLLGICFVCRCFKSFNAIRSSLSLRARWWIYGGK